MTRNSILFAVLMLGAGLALQAAADDKHHPQTKSEAASVSSAAWTEGEVRKIDKAAGTVTIKHGPMPKFDMPAMTMAYRVKDKAMLNQVKPGDKIKFDVDGAGGKFTVLRVEKVK